MNTEAIFSNHGTDYPYTYEYVDYLTKKGFNIRTVYPEVRDRQGNTWSNLYDYCYDKKIVPSRRFRWCTDKFKIQPVLKSIQKPCTIYIGFDKGELHRISKIKIHGVQYEYPLLNHQISREKCKELILDAGLIVPEKSCCFICPFCSKREVRRMQNNYPDQFEKLMALEENCMRKDLTYFERSLRSISGKDSQKISAWI